MRVHPTVQAFPGKEIRHQHKAWRAGRPTNRSPCEIESTRQQRLRETALTRSGRLVRGTRRCRRQQTSSSTGASANWPSKNASASWVARWYEPSTGTFTTVDPMLSQTGQPYSYAGDDPVNESDPSGLLTTPATSGVLCLPYDGSYYCPDANGVFNLGYGPCLNVLHANGLYGVANNECWVPPVTVNLQFNPIAGLEGAANFFAGAANFVTSTATLGFVRVPAPFCGGLLVVSYDIGQGTALIETGLAGGEIGDAGVAADASANEVPESAQKVLDYVETHEGEAPPGYIGGRTFGNYEGRLPPSDSDGNPITYQEYDVNPYEQGVNRGSERIVVGSDGSAYYTNDHYTTFLPIK